ncbi:ganglioside GM2 activator-like [Ctenocephalides felis]|uniref:ganglioside GM2 activator-like n=1 Tax=Ctenocephalides felis TaxID=7515 RepID=UPI000E6E25EE|nr:ganglioside GM2 activator-like [Ctenocephalides felis]
MASRILFILCILCLITVSYSFGFLFSRKNLTLKKLIIDKCDEESRDPVEFEDVGMDVDDEGYTQVWGTMKTSISLQSPIEVFVSMQRNVFGVWVHVPCVDGVGSCHYADVCNFGKPENVQCPPRFEKNGVPCRCPIEQGTYTLAQPGFNLEGNMKNAFSGLYRARVTASHDGLELACYTMKFQLKGS